MVEIMKKIIEYKKVGKATLKKFLNECLEGKRNLQTTHNKQSGDYGVYQDLADKIDVVEKNNFKLLKELLEGVGRSYATISFFKGEIIVYFGIYETIAIKEL